jgi:thiamine biosynthesis lipoprotein
MSALQWQDWSCTVRVVLDDDLPADVAPDSATAQRVELVVRQLMDDVARSASRFRGDSDLSRVNDAHGRLVPVRKLTIDLVDVALAAARRTDGACDPTIGRSLVAAGYDADIAEVQNRPPRPAHPVESLVDWTRVQVDHELGRIGVPATVALDLGATAKAWTADRAAERLGRDLGVPALVAIGGDVAASRDEHAWPVLVSEHEGGSGEVIWLDRGGAATSSIAGRTWLTTDGPAHHVIDPRSGAPVAGGYRTATVLAGSCVEANALSTAALVWGPAGLDRLSRHPARFVDGAGQVVTTESWPGLGVAA